MSDEIKNFVIDYFKDKGLPDLSSEAELLNYEYLDGGIIDSLGIVELITALESRFNIELSSHEMQSREFGTIGGLITIIERLVKKNE